ncbi:MAG: polysaccharide pyruvyl transferase family protein [Vicinamibacteraceae bacterium]
MTTPVSASSATPRLLLAGFYGVRNVGDELMLRCLVRWMDSVHPHVTVLSERPEECERTSALPALRNVPLLGQWAWYDAWGRGSAFRLIRQLRRFDGLVGGGGDVLRDDRGWRHFSFATEKYFVAKAFGTPWYVLNAGIGPPTTGYGRRILRYVLGRARQVVVRDRRGYDVALAARGPVQTYFAGDIVLSMPRLFPAECAAPLTSPRPAPYVLVCLRGNPDAFGRFAMPEPRLQQLASALDALAARGLRIGFLPFQQHDTEDDDTLHQAVAARMRRRDAIEFLPWTVDVTRIATLFRGASLVVAMRLHAAVLAEAFGAPTAIMAYDRKLLEFARQRGVTVIDAADLDRPESCRARLEDALDGRRDGAGEPPPHDWMDIAFQA